MSIQAQLTARPTRRPRALSDHYDQEPLLRPGPRLARASHIQTVYVVNVCRWLWVIGNWLTQCRVPAVFLQQIMQQMAQNSYWMGDFTGRLLACAKHVHQRDSTNRSGSNGDCSNLDDHIQHRCGSVKISWNRYK